jgi:hypothetical protein
MIATLLGVIGIDLKREVRHITVTVVLALVGAVLAILAIAIGLRALYLWLELHYGVFPALGILGGSSALIALVLFGFAFLRRNARPRPRVANPLRASAASLVEAGEQAMENATDTVRHGSRKQVYATILIAVLAGLVLGRKI